MISYTNPPVVESVLGVQFDPLPNFSNGHLGAFWTSLGKEWPSVSDAFAIEPSYESFGEEKMWIPPGGQLRVSQDVSTRIQIRNPTGTRMIQLQNGRFHLNWLGYMGDPYPSYSRLRPEFDRLWERFRSFVATVSLGEIVENQWEITYVDHIAKGTVWNGSEDWIKLLRGVPFPGARIAKGRLESFGGEWHFEIEPHLGRVHIRIQHGRGTKPEKDEPAEILVVTTTARGSIKNSRQAGLTLDAGLNLGREVVVKLFEAIFSEEAHNYWGKT
jgi:uncharacterized protein (TIGR04255 family)